MLFLYLSALTITFLKNTSKSIHKIANLILANDIFLTNCSVLMIL